MGVTKKFQQPPRTGMEVFMMLPEGTLAELINDTIYMSPSPDYYHQKILIKLLLDIQTYVEAEKTGECVVSPMDDHGYFSTGTNCDWVWDVAKCNPNIKNLIVEICLRHRFKNHVENIIKYCTISVVRRFLSFR